MEFVVADFMLYIEQQQQETGQPDGQAGNVDKGVNLVFDEVPVGNFEIVLEHDRRGFGFMSACDVPAILEYCSA